MQKDKIIIALKKARSSINRTIALIECSQDSDTQSQACFAVMQQNLAVIGLIKSANTLVLERHIDEVLAQCNQGDIAQLRDELVKIVSVAQKK